MEMHQLHQLHCKFILVQTCSEKESLDGFIKAHQKKTEFIDEKLFQERLHLSQYCGSICYLLTQ